MSTFQTRFIEPLDVLFLRGNKLFGDPGSHGESLVPPWPSAAAGALRSRMLADAAVDLNAFARGEVAHPALGTPQSPGSFAVTDFQLARRYGNGRVERLVAPPADLVIQQSEMATSPSVQRLHPNACAPGLLASHALPLLPVLAESQRSKPASGYWLSERGWQRYLAGTVPSAEDLVATRALWQIDHRVGIGLDTRTRSAADGHLFSMQAVCMTQRHHHSDPASADAFDVGFVVRVAGADVPQDGMLRFGGDGRAAAVHAVDELLVPEPDYAAIAQARRCRVVLTSPGLFSDGWRPTGVDAAWLFSLHGVRARLVCAAVTRAEVVSGWDLARQQPKAAWRAAPAGSVYWLDDIEASADALRKLVACGFWGAPGEDAQRRAEGFNRFQLATY